MKPTSATEKVSAHKPWRSPKKTVTIMKIELHAKTNRLLRPKVRDIK